MTIETEVEKALEDGKANPSSWMSDFFEKRAKEALEELRKVGREGLRPVERIALIYGIDNEIFTDDEVDAADNVYRKHEALRKIREKDEKRSRGQWGGMPYWREF